MTLIHFTTSPEAVANVLINGFAYVALPTKVASFVLPKIPPQEREPQQFGMICFRHEMDGECSTRHREKYGGFGIAIDKDWALGAGAHPVIYIQEHGSVASAFKGLLQSAMKQLELEQEKYPDDAARGMGYHNRAMAAVFGAAEWANLLDIFQYMAPAADEWEREWRIVQKLPIYSIPKTGHEAVAQVTPPQGWAQILNTLKFPNTAVQYLMCPQGFTSKLKSTLPERYANIEIREENT